MTLDLDSTVCEVCGKAKHGAAYGHTKVLGYHPLVAVRSDTGEVLHSRMRSGSSQRGNVHFARETLARLRRLAPAAVTVRADSGFFSYDMIAAIGAHGASYSITIPHNAKVKAAIAAIDDDDWAPIAYTRGGEAQVAESTITAGRRGDKLRGDDGERAEAAAHRAPHPPASAPNANCGPTGATTASSPTDTTSTPVPPTPTTEPTPPWSSPSETSKRAPGSAAAPPDDSSPTAPGSPAACSRTTSPAGPPASDAPTPQRSSPSRPPSATGSSPCQAASSTTAGRHKLRLPLNWPWANTFTTALQRHPQPAPTHLSRRSAPGAAQPNPTRHQPHQPRTPVLHAPKRAGPHTRTSPAATQPQTVDPTNPSVDSG